MKYVIPLLCCVLLLLLVVPASADCKCCGPNGCCSIAPANPGVCAPAGCPLPPVVEQGKLVCKSRTKTVIKNSACNCPSCAQETVVTKERTITKEVAPLRRPGQIVEGVCESAAHRLRTRPLLHRLRGKCCS